MFYKKRMIFLLVSFVFSVFLCSAISYWGDAGNIFYKKGKELKIASLMLAGHNVSNMGNVDERLLQEAYIKGLNSDCLDVLILGSSRSMGISSLLFPEGTRLVNSSVSGASIEDLIAIWNIYGRQSLIPKKVIIGIDPWMFNANNDQNRWRSLEQYLQGTPKIEIQSDTYFFKIKELLSIGYVIRSFNAALDNHGNYYLVDDVTALNPKDITRIKDGSIVYSNSERSLSRKKVIKKAKSYAASSPIYSLGCFKEIDQDYVFLLNFLLDKMLSKGVEVILWLPPYHPVVYRKMMSISDYKIVSQVEKILLDLASEKDIKLFGSYDPSKIGLDDNDFLDGMHLKKSGYKMAGLNRCF